MGAAGLEFGELVPPALLLHLKYREAMRSVPGPCPLQAVACACLRLWCCSEPRVLTRATLCRRSTRRPSRSAGTSSSSAPRTMPRPARRACGACSRTPRCPRRSSWPRRVSRSTSDRRRRARRRALRSASDQRRRAAPPPRPCPLQRAASAPAQERAAYAGPAWRGAAAVQGVDGGCERARGARRAGGGRGLADSLL